MKASMQDVNGYNILVVDDNSVNRKMIETVLGREGYHVLAACDGPEARRIAGDEKPDLILLDIRMPGEDGFDVIRALKNRAATASIPVIFLSGIDEIDSKLAGFDLGAVDYITKPFHPQEVLARVRLHLKLSIATNSLVADQAEKLRQVKEAHSALLPAPQSYPDARVGVFFLSLNEAGGDFYEILPISKDIFGYFVADFAGHDIRTSYLTAAVKALLRQNCTPAYHPAESLKIINDVLVEILPEGNYLTACYVHLNRRTMQMTILNAGHPPPVFVPRSGVSRLIPMSGDLLGIFRDVSFGRKTLTVARGDRLFLYSDGVVDMNGSRRPWTGNVNDMVALCAATAKTPIGDAPDSIIRSLRKTDNAFSDDAVILGFEV
jgi:sigma-B regulation protein RsbU (phosphoserine phosphatase)